MHASDDAGVARFLAPNEKHAEWEAIDQRATNDQVGVPKHNWEPLWCFADVSDRLADGIQELIAESRHPILIPSVGLVDVGFGFRPNDKARCHGSRCFEL